MTSTAAFSIPLLGNAASSFGDNVSTRLGFLEHTRKSSMASLADPAIHHLVKETTKRAQKWWTLSSCLGAIAIVFNEFHSWSSLSTRTIQGCSPANSTYFSNNTSTNSSSSFVQPSLSACATLGLFSCQNTLTALTSPPSEWSSALFVYMAAVAIFWLIVMWVLSNQNHRAALLLPYRIYASVKHSNGGLLFVAILLTIGYCAVKAVTFSKMPDEISLPSCGPSEGLVLALAPVFSTTTTTTESTTGNTSTSTTAPQSALWALASSTLILLLSFQGVYTVASRYAADCFADIGLNDILFCPKPVVVAATSATAADLTSTSEPQTPRGTIIYAKKNDPTVSASTSACPLHISHNEAAGETDILGKGIQFLGGSAVTRTLCSPFLSIDAVHLDSAMKAWFKERHLGTADLATGRKAHRWEQARFLVKCDAAEIEDAALYVKNWIQQK